MGLVGIVRWISMQNEYINRTLADFVEKLGLGFEVVVEKEFIILLENYKGHCTNDLNNG